MPDLASSTRNVSPRLTSPPWSCGDCGLLVPPHVLIGCGLLGTRIALSVLVADAVLLSMYSTVLWRLRSQPYVETDIALVVSTTLILPRHKLFVHVRKETPVNLTDLDMVGEKLIQVSGIKHANNSLKHQGTRCTFCVLLGKKKDLRY